MRRLVLIATLAACGNGKEAPRPAPLPADPRPAVEQVTPPIDIKTPPKDAVKTSSGLLYKKLVEKADGVAPKRNDTVAVNYTGWKQATGATFFTNRAQGQPMVLSLATTAAGFSEALQIAKKGEKVIVWIPPALGDKGNTDTLVYEFDLVEVVPAPEVPPDLKTPPAQTTKHGARYLVVKPGDAAKARAFDTVTFNYTAWDSEGRMFESTEMRKRPATSIPYRQSPVIADALVLAGKGGRVRVWTDSTQITTAGGAAGIPTGPLVYEFQIDEIVKAAGEPAPVPADVAAPPADAKRTKSGVAYKILKKGSGGPKPGPTDEVTIDYTGWTTDGRLVGSSQLEGKPERAKLDGVIAGWTDAIMMMSAGDRVRMWIPDALAYKGAPGKPQGTLVYDLELVAFGPKPTDASTAAPSDVAAPPADAKQSPSGVAYKILKAKPGKKPTPKDTVRVVFTGWTTDGKVFDSSKGKPYETKLTNVIDGWAETIPLMSVGEKARLWIPERLAYGGAEGAPAGMLVFDIELLEIVK
jgi:FKBP-type peptidyl-prolyl cis-trans isomerase